MKNPFLLSALLACSFSVNCQSKHETVPLDKLIPANPSEIKMKGFIGEKIDFCINERNKKQDYDYLVEPFRHRKETRLWQSEFWGKWMLRQLKHGGTRRIRN